MKTQDAIDFFGSNSVLTELLGLSTGAISQWGESPPDLRQLQIESLSGGVLKADKAILPRKTRKPTHKAAANA
jgi:DNA-binding transcriptional regulator YdaS (Cro superfamily)